MVMFLLSSRTYDSERRPAYARVYLILSVGVKLGDVAHRLIVRSVGVVDPDLYMNGALDSSQKQGARGLIIIFSRTTRGSAR